jgi:hypothetical protein
VLPSRLVATAAEERLSIKRNLNTSFAAARDRFAYERRPAIAYSRVGTARTLSAVPSSSNSLDSHLGSEFGLIARSYRAFSSPLIAP